MRKECQGCDCETPCTTTVTTHNQKMGNFFKQKIAQDNRTKCREYGGKAHPSTGLVNLHNIGKSYRRGEVEFETPLVSCLKCSVCGHSWN